MKKLDHFVEIALAAAILATPGASIAQTFGYLGDIGPSHWAELSPDWATCGIGELQSPVDFVRLPPRPAVSRRFSIDYGTTTGEIFSNGHTIEVETGGENTLTLHGVVYELDQFHFHTPSEHTVNGRGFDMEMHLVHSGPGNSKAVLGVFLKRGPDSGALAPIFGNLPDDINVHHHLEAPFDPAGFLPKSKVHYRYLGSLTTPPCTEGVQWVVMSEPVTISDEDMAQFAERIPFNSRLIQRRLK